MELRSRDAAVRVIRKPEHGNEEWLRLRHRDSHNRVVFGASEIPSLMGTSLYETRAALIARKLADVSTTEASPAMLTGNLVEPVLVAEASRRLGVEIVTPPFMFGRGRIVATPDGIDDETVTRLFLSANVAGAVPVPRFWIEAKCTARFRVKSPDDVPNSWKWQMAAQAFACGATAETTQFVLVVLDSDLHINVIPMPRNYEAEDALANCADALGKALDNGEIPLEDVETMTAEQIARVFTADDSAVELPEDASEWLFALQDATDARKTAEKHEKTCRDWFAQKLRNATTGTLGGETVVTWKEQRGRVTLDAQGLERDHPEIFAKYQKQGEPFRVMRLTRKKGER
jgi:predicted phage-related endonuclease